MHRRIASCSHIGVGRTLVVLRRRLIAITRTLIMISPSLIGVTDRLIPVGESAILLTPAATLVGNARLIVRVSPSRIVPIRSGVAILGRTGPIAA